MLSNFIYLQKVHKRRKNTRCNVVLGQKFPGEELRKQKFVVSEIFASKTQ